MITETYQGRKIRIVKGRGQDFGYSRVTLNGTDLGRWQGDENKVQGRIRGSIDAVVADGINGNKYGAEWYAPGTFELCENGHPKEIGDECLHSYCIERRPVPAATETTPEPIKRPAMKRINITPKMADALGLTIEINGKQAMIMSHPKTQHALYLRGLATEFGYLTDQGRFIAHLIATGGTPRSWHWDTIEAATRTWVSDQKRHAASAEAAPTLEDVELPSDQADREQARREAAEPTLEEYAQASRAIQSHIPNGRNVLRNSD